MNYLDLVTSQVGELVADQATEGGIADDADYLFAWLFRFRRLVTRWEYKSLNFLGFLWLGCLIILLRRL